MTNWPNLFVVGAARAGTTSLAYYLDQHPDIFMSRVKEPYYFTHYHPDWVSVPHERSAYLELFRDGDSARYRGEASPAYLWDETSAGAIKEASPDARIIVSLRNPITRAYSEYLLLRRSIEEQRASFYEVVTQELKLDKQARGDDPRYNYVARGQYAEGLSRFFDTFGRDRVHVVFFEEFVRDPADGMRRIFEFLGVSPDVANRITFDIKNQGGVPRNKLAEKLLYSSRARAVARRALPLAARSELERRLMRSPDSNIEPRARQALERVYSGDRRSLELLLSRPVPW
jgi:hypothetical protein